MQLKMYFFVPFVRPCMHHNYGVISESHACKDCGWLTILDAELYTTCAGERLLVVIRFNVAFLHLKHYYENTSNCFSKCAESPTSYGCVLWFSQIVYIRPYSLNTAIAFYLLCDWVLGRCSACSFESVPCHKAFVLYLASPSIGISVLLCSSVVPKCYGLANNTVNVSVTLWLGLQRRCKTFCKVSVCNPVNQPPMPFKNVLFCTFISTCLVQKECVCSMGLASADKVDHYHRHYDKIILEAWAFLTLQSARYCLGTFALKLSSFEWSIMCPDNLLWLLEILVLLL